MHKFEAPNNRLNSHIREDRKKKATYKLKDGKIVNIQTKEQIGWFTHFGKPNPGERFCKAGREWVSYLPLAEQGI